VIFAGVDESTEEVKISLPVGHYECQVENEYGTASSLIYVNDPGMFSKLFTQKMSLSISSKI